MTRPLISPEQSQVLILIASVFLSVVGALLGFWFKRTRGLVAVFVGPLVFGLWLAHGALQARFGMDSLGLLIFEGLVFVGLGAVLGLGWNWLGASKQED